MGFKSIIFVCSIWKKCQLFVNDVVQEYQKMSVFSHAAVFGIGKNPLALVLICPIADTLVLSVLISWSTLYFLATGDVGAS